MRAKILYAISSCEMYQALSLIEQCEVNDIVEKAHQLMICMLTNPESVYDFSLIIKRLVSKNGNDKFIKIYKNEQ